MTAVRALARRLKAALYARRGWTYRAAKAARVWLQSRARPGPEGRGVVSLVLAVDTEGPCTGRPGDLATWEAVDALVARAMSDDFRRRLLDSTGAPVKLSWFLEDARYCRDPRRRAVAPFEILDHYRDRWGEARSQRGDGLYWHYHHYPLSGDFRPDVDWLTNRRYDSLLTELLVERQFLPSVVRTGWTSSSTVFSDWLDRVIPFDFSSCAPYGFGRLADWTRAPASWQPYRPSSADYQRPAPPGDAAAHHVFRTLDADNPGWCTRWELEEAFVTARRGGRACLAFFSHDYRDLVAQFTPLLQRIGSLAERYPDVTFRHATAVEGARWTLGLADLTPLELQAELAATGEVRATADREPFSESPWLALRDRAGGYHRLPGARDPGEASTWRWTLPAGTETAVVGAIDACGETRALRVV